MFSQILCEKFSVCILTLLTFHSGKDKISPTHSIYIYSNLFNSHANSDIFMDKCIDKFTETYNRMTNI
jgi:hypothetical protein